MARVTYVEHDGTEHPVDVAPGETIMEGAVNNGVPGIDADCGGVCSCATCHVYMSEEAQSHFAEPTPLEAQMLEFAAGRKDCSRLSCRLVVDEAVDELRVDLPESQF